MYGARDIFLLAAEDAFEFEKWREAGPVIGDIDPEARAAEIAEFEALAIPMPAELDSLRRELEHAPKIREALRNSATALRRSGRATASSLVALGPQHLMHPGMAWGMPGAPMIDPRLAAQLAGQMVAGQMAAQAAADARTSVPEPEPRARKSRERKLANATVVAEHGPVEAEVVSGYAPEDDDIDEDDEDDDADDDDIDEDEPPPRKSKSPREPARASKPKPKPRPAPEWDEDEDEDDSSLVAAPMPPPSNERNTWILGGIAAVAVIAMLYMVMSKKDEPAPGLTPEQLALQQQLAQQQQQLAQQQQQAPPPEAPPPAIDPNTGLPYGQAPAPAVEQPATSSGRSGGGGRSSSAGSSSSTPASGGGINPFAGFKTDAITPGGQAPAGGGQAPAPAGGQAPAGGGQAPAPAPAGGGQAPAPAGGEAAAGGQAPAPAGGEAAAGGQAPAPAEQPKPAEPKPEELLPKSKMTPAIDGAVRSKASELWACYQDATVAKPDLAGNVKFEIILDPDGVVTKVDVVVDEIGYGVAKCAAKKIKRWTLPGTGLPFRFDLPFKFG